MSDHEAPLGSLAINFVLLSFFAVGGMNAVLPEVHRYVVTVNGWMGDQRFTDLFAIAQAAPGPNILVATLIGWDVAGFSGAAVTTIAMIAPTSIIAYVVGQLWHRFRFARWRIVIQAGVVPVTVGLVAASAYVLMLAADRSLAALALTVVTAFALYFTRLHPLIFLAAGGLLGVLGLI